MVVVVVILGLPVLVVANDDREFGGFVYCSCLGGERDGEEEREREEETCGRIKKRIKKEYLNEDLKKKKPNNIWYIVKWSVK